MEFGSWEVFELIRQNIEDSQNFDWYNTLAECIQSDCRRKLTQYGLSAEDREDITQEIQLKVFRNLSSFYCNDASNTEGQRDAWLNTIIRNTVNDFLRAARLNVKLLSLDDEENPVDVSDELDVDEKNAAKAQLFEAIHFVSTIDTSPEKMMAFLLNKMASVFYKKSGKPKDIEKTYYGRPLLEVFRELQKQLSLFLGYEIPKEILLPLWEKIEPRQEELFLRKASNISSDTNWITKKINQ